METDSPATTTFAQVLAHTRAAAGLTQEELAERAELSVRAVSNLERGEASRPRRGTIDRLVAALGLTGGDARRFTDIARGRPAAALPDGPPEPAGPAQLPTDLPDFTGRTGESARLAELLSGDGTGVRIVVVGGGGGVGKTALAVRVAHRLRHRFPDGQLYVDLAGSRDAEVAPATALAAFLSAYGGEPREGEDTARRAARYRSVLAGRRVLVVLDDARDAAQVRPLLPAGAGSAVLVTSRNRLPDLAGARHLIVGELAAGDATDLFARIAGSDRVAREAEATARVVAACDRLPLAVRIAGARLAVRPEWSVAALADRLAAARGTLDELRAGDLAVRSSFRLSYDRLTMSSARMFALLGHWPGHDLGVPAAAALAGTDEPTAERLLELLVDAHLLESPAPARYRQHDLLHAFAGELLAGEIGADASREALTRLFSYLTATAYEADLALWPASGPPFPAESVADPRAAPFTGYEAAMRWYAAEWPALDALLRKASADDSVPAALAARFAALVTLFPFVREDLVGLERGSRHAATLAERAGDHLLAANAHKRLGFAMAQLHRTDEAAEHQERALAAFRAAGDLEGEAGMLNSIGRRLLTDAHTTPGYDVARRYLRDGLAAARATGRGSAQVTALGNLGRLEHRAGRYVEAHEYLTEALALSRKLGARQLEAAVAGSLGTVLAALGRPAEAVGRHDQALRVSRALCDRSGEVVALRELAETYRVTGRADRAAEYAEQALALHREYGGSDDSGAAVLVTLGRALAALGRTGEAREHWSRALSTLADRDPAAADEVRGLLGPA